MELRRSRTRSSVLILGEAQGRALLGELNMLYLYSKDFISTSNREVLFYSSALYDPPDNIKPNNAALNVLRKARSVLGEDGFLNPIAGVWDGSRYVTFLRWGITQDSFDLLNLCTGDRSNDPVSPLTSKRSGYYSTYGDGTINTVALLTGAAPVRSNVDYQFTNPTFSGTLGITYTYDVQQVSGTKQPNQTYEIQYLVSPLGSSSRYSGVTTMTFSSDPCAVSYGRRFPKSSRAETVVTSVYSGGLPLSTTSDARESVILDCFLMYDPASGVFKKYGAEMIASPIGALTPGNRYSVALNSRGNHATIDL